MREISCKVQVERSASTASTTGWSPEAETQNSVRRPSSRSTVMYQVSMSRIVLVLDRTAMAANWGLMENRPSAPQSWSHTSSR